MIAVLVVVELVADELLGLDDVRRDDVGLGADGEAHRLAVGVDDGLHAELAQLLDELRVDARCSTPRGSEPANTTTSAPRARYRSLSRKSSISLALTAGPRSLISVVSPFVGS